MKSKHDRRKRLSHLGLASVVAAATLHSQVQNYNPVTAEMLLNPSPDDWLMYRRT